MQINSAELKRMAQMIPSKVVKYDDGIIKAWLVVH